MQGSGNCNNQVIPGLQDTVLTARQLKNDIYYLTGAKGYDISLFCGTPIYA
jgi:hypothetical protein